MTTVLTMIIVQGFVKVLNYLRIFPKLGQIIRLCYKVISFASAFSIFFYLFCSMFALIYRVNGVDIGGHPDSKHGDGDDYENLLPFLSFFMYAYRTSIGDLEAPNAGNWMKLVDSPNYMVYLIWTIWMLHQWFMNIVFLNFLIAIVS